MEQPAADTMLGEPLGRPTPEPSPEALATEIQETVDNLHTRFPVLGPDVVGERVGDAVGAMQPVRVSRFVPVLAERAARRGLERDFPEAGATEADATTAPGTAPADGRRHDKAIVVGFDGSLPSRLALRWALAEAGRRGVACSVVEAWPHGDRVSGAAGDDLRTQRAQLSSDVDEVCRQSGFARPWEVRLESGNAEDVLARVAAGAGLLVVGSRGRGALENLLLGSVSNAVLDRRPCPIVVVPTGASVRGRCQRIVVGVDGSAAAARALCWAAEEARTADAVLAVVHAWRLPVIVGSPYLPTVPIDASEQRQAAQETLDRALRMLPSSTTPPIEPRLAEGDAASILRQAAESADLLVVGSSSHGKFVATVLGSTSRDCAHQAPCPVAVVA